MFRIPSGSDHVFICLAVLMFGVEVQSVFRWLQARQLLYDPDDECMRLYPMLLESAPDGAPDDHPQVKTQVRQGPGAEVWGLAFTLFTTYNEKMHAGSCTRHLLEFGMCGAVTSGLFRFPCHQPKVLLEILSCCQKTMADRNVVHDS